MAVSYFTSGPAHSDGFQQPGTALPITTENSSFSYFGPSGSTNTSETYQHNLTGITHHFDLLASLMGQENSANVDTNIYPSNS